VGFFIGGDRIRGITEWQDIFLEREIVGTVTEAVYSPRLMRNIAVGMLSSEIANDVRGLETNLGDGRRPANVAPLPFIPQ
jgi:glycine cleavage system aminomethyltransferase T